jgi:DNA-binding CsgD family transcriptional regulator
MSARVSSSVVVGRDGELAALCEALADVRAGAPATVLVGGEAGVGKSRLLREFGEQAGTSARLLVGGCVELGASGLPYVPFTAALRTLVRAIGPAALTRLLPEDEPGELARLLPGLGRPEPGGDADEARARLFEQLLALLERLAADRPVVLVLEDAHWADRSSRDLLDFLVRNQQAAPGLLLAVSYRTEELHRAHPLRRRLAELDRVEWVRRLDVPRLGRRYVTALVRGILGHEPGAGLMEAIQGRSEGNPLFVESLLDAGLQSGSELPESLRDLLLAQIERLPERSREVVRTAAAAGPRMRHELLAAVTGLDDATLSDSLRQAVSANTLLIDGDEYAFRHALLRDAAYADLLPGERTRVHARYAEALTSDAALAPADRAEIELAHHWHAAREWTRALPAAWAAAAEAGECMAYAEQLELLDRALELWESVPDAAVTIGAAHRAVLEQAVEAAFHAGEYERAEVLATAALAEVDPVDERVRTALLLDQRGRIRHRLGHDGDLADHREAVRTVGADDPARPFVLTELAGRLLETAHGGDEARAAAQEALALAQRIGDDYSEASALITLATLEARQGDLAAQLPRLADARAVAERIGAHALLMRAIQWESALLQAYGKDAQAARVARSGLAAAREAGLARASSPPHAVNLVCALIAAGQWDEALDSVEHALELAPSPAFHAHLLCLRGVVALARGDPRPAESAVGAAREQFGPGACFAQDPLLVRQLEAELLVGGSPIDAAAVVERTLADYDLAPISRFGWPLLSLAARVAAAQPEEEQRERLLAQLRAQAARLPVLTPVQRADRLTFVAEAGSADGRHDRAAWDAAVAAWDEIGRLYDLARALRRAAEAALLDGDRGAAASRLRRAAELAAGLEAGPLRESIEAFARRARIALDTERAEPAGDPVEELGLTARQADVLRLVAAGRRNRDIADELFISPKTASVHVSHILTKLGVTTRGEAAAMAHRLGVEA